MASEKNFLILGTNQYVGRPQNIFGGTFKFD